MKKKPPSRAEIMSRAKTFILYQTACGHVTRSALGSYPGAGVYCIIDKQRTVITDIQVEEWHARCETNNRCHYSHFTGTSEQLAKASANAHFRATHHSKIIVARDANPAANKELLRWVRQGLWPLPEIVDLNTISPGAASKNNAKKIQSAPDSTTAYPTES